jgi:predicted AAA+ superfamily ATPase
LDINYRTQSGLEVDFVLEDAEGRIVGVEVKAKSRVGAAQYLNWDVLADRAVLQRQSWNPRAKLLVMDEIHKMGGWKGWLMGRLCW